MNHLLRSLLLFAMLAGLGLAHSTLMAQEQTTPAVEQAIDPEREIERAQAEVERAEAELERAEREIEDNLERRWRRRERGEENVVIHIGDDSSLPAGESANAVIAVFGSASAAGEVYEAVVAIAGDASATGSVGEGVVALFGNVYVDGPVEQDVVALFGDVQLGPNAIVDGEVVSVGGTIKRDPSAVVHGPQQQIAFGRNFGRLEWLKPWFEQCLLYGRPLAFDSSVAWAWWIAFGFLSLYVVLALLFDASVERCVTTLEQRPLQSVVASVLAALLTPVLLILLMITVIGLAVVPFLLLGIFCAALFGKAVVLATLGRRITRFTGIGAFAHVAFATLLGGLIVMGLYAVPVFGIIVFNLVGILGFGVVIYTLIASLRINTQAAPAMATAAAPQPAATDIPNGAAVPPPSMSARAVDPTNIELVALPRAGFWIRMGALLIDVLLVGVLANWLEPSAHLFLVVLAGYGALMWKLKGTTIGGIVCNLRVVRTDGRDIEWETALVRALSCFLSLIPAGLGFVWMLFDNNRQTWHDKIAGTVVVRVPRTQPLV